MMKNLSIALWLFASFAVAGAQDVRLDVSSLSSWAPLDFPKIPNHTIYAATNEDGAPAIRVEATASASALVYSRTFDLRSTPVLSWSWKVLNVLPRGDAETREGDDYPIRVYILFPYQSRRVPPLQRLQFELAKQLYGSYPPEAVLNYVWANRPHTSEPLPNAYTDRAMMFFPDVGNDHVGEWRTHTVNILEDYRRAFGQEPPDTFSLAIMGDSDNTGGQSVAFVRGISLAAAARETEGGGGTQ